MWPWSANVCVSFLQVSSVGLATCWGYVPGSLPVTAGRGSMNLGLRIGGVEKDGWIKQVHPPARKLSCSSRARHVAVAAGQRLVWALIRAGQGHSHSYPSWNVCRHTQKKERKKKKGGGGKSHIWQNNEPTSLVKVTTFPAVLWPVRKPPELTLARSFRYLGFCFHCSFPLSSSLSLVLITSSLSRFPHTLFSLLLRRISVVFVRLIHCSAASSTLI